MEKMILAIVVAVLFFTFLIYVYFVTISPSPVQLGDFSSIDPSKNPNALPEGFKVPISYSCSKDSDCKLGLKCDPNTFRCKLDIGSKCDTSNDCVTGTFCNGTCISDEVPVGIDVEDDPLFFLSPCPDGYVSSLKNNMTPDNSNGQGELICLRGPCESCTESKQCASFSCQYFDPLISDFVDCIAGKNCICRALKGLGSICNDNLQCGSNNCLLMTEEKSTCQNQGETIESIGLSCGIDEICPIGQNCFNGVCGKPVAGLLEGCSNTSLCPSFANCYNLPNINYDEEGIPTFNDGETYSFCQPGSRLCSCQFYTISDGNRIGLVDPNKIDTSVKQQCIPGMGTIDQVSPDGISTCKMKENQPTDDFFNCTSNQSESGNFLYVLNVPLLIDGTRNGTYPMEGLIGTKNFFYKPINLNKMRVKKFTGLSFGYGIDFLNRESEVDVDFFPEKAREVIVVLDDSGDLHLTKYRPEDLNEGSTTTDPVGNLDLSLCEVDFVGENRSPLSLNISDISSTNVISDEISVPTLYALTNDGIWELKIDPENIFGCPSSKVIITTKPVISLPSPFSSYNKLSSYNYHPPKNVNSLVKATGETGGSDIYHLVSTPEEESFLFRNISDDNILSNSDSFNPSLSRGELNEVFDPNIEGVEYSLGYMTLSGEKLETRIFDSDFKSSVVKNFLFPNYVNPQLSSKSYQFGIISNDLRNYQYKNFVILSSTVLENDVGLLGLSNLFYISNGTQMALPGHFSNGTTTEGIPPDTVSANNVVFSMTPTQLYVMSNQRCSL